MGVGTAAARHKAHDEILIELNRFTWRQVVGTDDYRVVNLGCPIEIALHEGAQDLSHNIVDVGSTGFHVFIVHGSSMAANCSPARSTAPSAVKWLSVMSPSIMSTRSGSWSII